MKRKCDLLNIAEVSDLKAGMDFRLPEYRREVFLRFYEFHSRYAAHPGAVYYAFPWLFKEWGLDYEQKLWFCFINGLCQNVLTTAEIFQKFPSFEEVRRSPQLLITWFNINYSKFGWDTDRRYVKAKFEQCIRSYISCMRGKPQAAFFAKNTFGELWYNVINSFAFFGRLSTFSYLEYLRIAGVDIDCDTLFLDDISGSKSHRNGLCKVLGRDDLDWHQSNPDFNGKYDSRLLRWLKAEGEVLLSEAKQRFAGASYFTLESTLCCYKSWHRPNRRYPNVYNDLFYERILVNEKSWGRTNDLFRRLRKECLPNSLLVECCPGDVGAKPLKQNHYLNTGQVIMMDNDWPCFVNDYNNKLK